MANPEPRNDGLFDFERLVVYQKTLELARLLAPFLQAPPRKAAKLCDELDRATDSVLLNVPEGAGRAPRSKDRLHFYRIALGSAKEGASAVIALHAKGHMPKALHDSARCLLLEIVSMLSTMTKP